MDTIVNTANIIDPIPAGYFTDTDDAAPVFDAEAGHSPFVFIESHAGLGPLVPESIATRLDVARRAQTGGAQSRHLLDGFETLVHFLLAEETNYLCGAPCRARSNQRVNFRGGYRERKLTTPLGTISLRVPLLRYLHPRVSIVKRAKRLSSGVIAQLTRIRASSSVTNDDAALLIKALWTVPLTDELLSCLATKLVPLLDEWRETAAGTPPGHTPPSSTATASAASADMTRALNASPALDDTDSFPSDTLSPAAFCYAI